MGSSFMCLFLCYGWAEGQLQSTSGLLINFWWAACYLLDPDFLAKLC